MIKKKFYLAALLLCSFCIQAQEKITVAFIPMSYDEDMVSKMEAKIIQETIINGFVAAKRFTVVDRSNLESIENEKKLQRTESFMDSKESIKQGISKGASYMIQGNIIGIKHIDKKSKWSSTVTIQVKVLDVSTGEILTTESINSEPIPENDATKDIFKAYYSKDEIKANENLKNQMMELKDNSDASFKVALDRLSENVKLFLSKSFPMHIEIAEWIGKGGKTSVSPAMASAYKGSLKDFVMASGANAGVSKGQILDIVTVSSVTIGDKTVDRQKKIGSAFVVRVDDGNFSSATIIDGEKSIKKAISENATIGVVSK